MKGAPKIKRATLHVAQPVTIVGIRRRESTSALAEVLRLVGEYGPPPPLWFPHAIALHLARWGPLAMGLHLHERPHS